MLKKNLPKSTIFGICWEERNPEENLRESECLGCDGLSANLAYSGIDGG
jgi:hypothetical protein